MDEASLRVLINELERGAISADEAVIRLRQLPFADLGYARVDHQRALRQGMPEAVYAPGKTAEQCVGIVGELLTHGDGPVLVTRTDNAQRGALLATYPDATIADATLLWRAGVPQSASVAIVTAGTADLPVANEAELTLTGFGYKAELFADCGVAGLHRLLASVGDLQQMDGLIVVAGMEGALASVVGGLTAAPVVAVPTSVGYGSSLEGVTALLAMLSSCAAGVSVVGIDNGYGAACALARALR